MSQVAQGRSSELYKSFKINYYGFMSRTVSNMMLSLKKKCSLWFLLSVFILPLVYCSGEGTREIISTEEQIVQIGNNNHKQTDVIEEVCNAFNISKVVPESNVESFDKTTQLKIKNDIEIVKQLLRYLSAISMHAMKDEYTNQELVEICQILTNLQPKILKKGEIGSVNIELQNMVSLLQCGLTYLVLSHPEFVDYNKLNYLGTSNYPNNIISPEVLKEICIQEGEHDFNKEFLKEEDVLIDAIKNKYPQAVEAYMKKKKQSEFISFI